MKTKPTPKKIPALELRKETLRRLTPKELRQIAGGFRDGETDTVIRSSDTQTVTE